jgi:hypothetical protein
MASRGQPDPRAAALRDTLEEAERGELAQQVVHRLLRHLGRLRELDRPATVRAGILKDVQVRRMQLGEPVRHEVGMNLPANRDHRPPQQRTDQGWGCFLGQVSVPLVG